MPITVHTSNRMEILLNHLAETLKVPVGSPLSPETIVVQSRGMERWISTELAKKFGVWGNTLFPFPNKFVWDLFAAAMPKVEKSCAFDPEILTWRVTERLEGLLDKPEFIELQRYLTGHSRGLKMYQLAGKIADTFDQYTLYRGDVLERWEAGEDSSWQAILWRALAEEGENGNHRASVKTEFLTQLKNGKIAPSLLPPRVLLFGLSYMPAFHLELLAAIASFVDVQIFVLSPCREYWGDILSEKRAGRVRKELLELSDVGNALLSSLGGLGRDFSNLLLESGAQFGSEQEEYEESSGDTLLSSLQNGILNLIDADPENKIHIAPGDSSIAVHSCHSPMREVEVLHDRLLDMFATMEGLTPRDIIVMTPDIETYSPYISAVFSGNQDQKRRIPFTIADRSIRSEGRVGEALLAILALPGGRFTAPEVIGILAADPVRRCFGISQGDIDLVKSWLEETHISWGMDEKERSALGLPPYSEGSWMAGLERLVFGYAMSSDGFDLVHGILPFDNMEGDAATLLGRFVQFVRSLHALASDLGRGRTLAGWRDTLRYVLQNFFKPSDQDAREFSSIEKVVDSLGNIEKQSGYASEIGLDVIRSWVKSRIESEGGGVGFLSGRVTFCAMLPMRSIPARVVALLGMNDGSFPRQSRSPGFDIIPADPRPGDRSLRDEDRYLFLEALLSARERLYISYTGLSIRDNSVIPPSVLVSELLDFLDRGYIRTSFHQPLLPPISGDLGKDAPDFPPPLQGEGRGGDGVDSMVSGSSQKQPHPHPNLPFMPQRVLEGEGTFTQTLLTSHRLQPFSPAYFSGEETGLFSYSAENLSAARGLLNAGTAPPRFFTAALPPPDEAFRDVRIYDLLKFFENPALFILRHRLGIKPEGEASQLEEREIFEIDNLLAYSIKQEMLAFIIDGKGTDELLPVLRARGELPPAGAGDALFEKLSKDVTDFTDQIKETIAGEPFLPHLDVDLKVGEFRIHGRIANILPELLLRYRSSKLSAKDQVKLWIEHLILNTAAAGGYPKRSRLIMLDDCVTLEPVTDGEAQLKLLLDRYWEGLTAPLHFFPRSSLEYAKKGKISAAEYAWKGGDYPERDGEGYSLCFGDESPLDSAFEMIATEVFKPYLNSLEEKP